MIIRTFSLSLFSPLAFVAFEYANSAALEILRCLNVKGNKCFNYSETISAFLILSFSFLHAKTSEQTLSTRII